MKLTVRQTRFVEEYLKDFNSTQAAIRAGYSKRTAYSIGSENLRKPDIIEATNRRLKELSLSAEEVTKRISDIARSSLSDYFVVRKVEYSPRLEVSLKVVIKELEETIAFENEFAKRANLNKDEYKLHKAQQDSREREVLRYEIELEKNPSATRIVSGPTEWREVAELDMPRLVRDKETGRIKSYKITEHGVNIELYPSDSALRDLARINGLFKDNLKVDASDELLNLYKTVMAKE